MCHRPRTRHGASEQSREPDRPPAGEDDPDDVPTDGDPVHERDTPPTRGPVASVLRATFERLAALVA